MASACSSCLGCVTPVLFTFIDCVAATLGVDAIFYYSYLCGSALWEGRLLWHIGMCMCLLVTNLLDAITLWREVSHAALNAPTIHPASYLDSRAKLVVLVWFSSWYAYMLAERLVYKTLKGTLVPPRANPRATNWRREAQYFNGALKMLWKARLCFASIWVLSRVSSTLSQGAYLPVTASTYGGSFNTWWGLIVTSILGVYGTVMYITGITAIFALGFDLLGMKLRLWPDGHGTDPRAQDDKLAAEMGDMGDGRGPEENKKASTAGPSTENGGDARKERDDEIDIRHFPYGVEEKAAEPGKWMLYLGGCRARRHLDDQWVPSCTCGEEAVKKPW